MIDAEKWAKHLDEGGSTKPMTVAEACQAYADSVRASGRDDSAGDVEGRYRRWVNDTKFGATPLDKLTRRQVTAWRLKLKATSVVENPHAAQPRTRMRTDAALNRDMTALRAALNYAFELKDVTSNDAWLKALKQEDNAGEPRKIYLDRDQRRKWIAEAPEDVACLLKGLSRLPVRVGALVKLKVEDFQESLSTVFVGLDKKKAPRRIKLPRITNDFFAFLAKGKSAGEFLFTRANGTCWAKKTWGKAVKASAIKAGLSDKVVATVMRHSVITDLVIGGLDVFDVAALAGTSVEMIQKHYKQHLDERSTAALASLVL